MSYFLNMNFIQMILVVIKFCLLFVILNIITKNLLGYLLNMVRFIKWVLVQLNVHTFGDLYRRWEEALDWFFYFNKATGCGVPSIEEVRRYL